MAVDPLRLKDRIWEADLIQWRGFRLTAMQDWKNRLKVVDALYRGDWAEVFPDETVMKENPHVMNMVQVGLDDIAKLVTEATPSVKCFPTKDTEDGERGALIRAAIADTYWEVNHGEMLVPRVAMDLAGAGAAFLVSYIDSKSDYPCTFRVDPRYAYPDFINGRLQNLMVLETVNIRVAAREFPDLGLDTDPTITGTTVDLLHYYSPQECLMAVYFTAGRQQMLKIVKRWNPKGILPVAFVQLDSFDGQLRGMFDQITGSLQTKNRIIKQLLDYTDEVVYADPWSKGLLNPEKIPGDGTPYRLDHNVPDAAIGRVPPAASAPQVFQILEYLDREQRGAAGYPSSRQGEVSQSIASASFVASTQGQLTSTVRNIQRLIENLRTQTNEICFQLDESKTLNMEKALIRPIGRKKTYTPKKDIAGEYKNVVTYGAAAGLDRINADVRIIQLLGANIISKDDAREQIDFISDPAAVSNRVDMEVTETAVMQKFLQEAPLPLLMRVLALQAEGKSLPEAVQAVSQEQQAQTPAAPATGAPGAEQPMGPGEAGLQQQALQAGGQPPEAPIQPPAFAPPPVEDVSVQTPTPARPGQAIRNTQ